jgi:hypothetical protein
VFGIRAIKSRIIWAGHAARMGDMINAYKLLVGKFEGERPSRGRPRCSWEDNIRMNLGE